jgi:hypothetical protein
MKLKLDLHDIYNRGQDIDRALEAIIDEAVAKKAPMVEIIPGKGSGQLKKHVLKFLDRKDIKAKYHRVEKDSKNFGRLFVHFRWYPCTPRSTAVNPAGLPDASVGQRLAERAAEGALRANFQLVLRVS